MRELSNIAQVLAIHSLLKSSSIKNLMIKTKNTVLKANLKSRYYTKSKINHNLLIISKKIYLIIIIIISINRIRNLNHDHAQMRKIID